MATDDTTPQEGEDYGRRLLPAVVDKTARTRPDRVVYSLPITEDPADGFDDVTVRRFANSVNRTAWWIVESFGKPVPGSFPGIGYVGLNDLRYSILMLAAVKAGYKMVFLSPRNSIDGHLAVIDKSDCKLWALPAQRVGHVDRILEKRPLKVAHFPELSELLHHELVPDFPYERKFAQARQEPFVVLHTSGSTGLPKPIVVPNGSLATPDAHHLLPTIEGRPTITQLFCTPYRVYSTFPMFHSAGMVFCTAIPFFYDGTIVMGPATVPVNLDLINSMFDHTNVQGSLLAPSTLEDISKDPASLEKIAKTDFTFFGGGPLSQECGDRINAVCRVFNIVGVTEGSLFPIVQPEREDWNCLHFHPAAGFTYKQRTGDLWEQFQTRDPKLDLFQAFLQTFPDKDEVAIKDLYAKHPTKPGRWSYRGRADDVLVLSNGEKVNPLDMEACINSHPAVRASLVVGQGKFQTTALIELREPLPTTEECLNALKDSLWTKMEVANIEAPAHGQLHKDFVMFATADKPFVLAGKGTVMRAATVQSYSQEITDFYHSQELRQSSEAVIIDAESVETIQSGLQALLRQILHNDDLSKSDDFFVAGLDSLSVFNVLATLRATLRSVQIDDRAIKIGLVYSNPSVEKLSKAFDLLIRPTSTDGDTVTTVQQMEDMLEKYTADLPTRSSQPIPKKVDKATVLLTGSTGSLGSYLLDDLLSNDHVRKVYCLNRSADAQQRQIKANHTRALKQDLTSDRVKFLRADLSKPNFGLKVEDYNELQSEVTNIIHNQWQVDFNLNLSSFEPHVRGVRHLVDFSLQNPFNPSIFFISSVGVVKAQKTNNSIPEKMVTDFSGAEGGYGSSKLVAEWILERSSIVSGVDCSICRLGQIAGPVGTEGGVWNRQEWLPSIIASSSYLSKIPSTLSSLDRIDWLPVNHTSKIILELEGLSHSPSPENHESQPPASPPPSPRSAKIYHAINPRTTPWSTLLPAVTSSFPSASIVPWQTWLRALQDSGEAKAANLEKNPALKLLDFYENLEVGEGYQLPVLETKETCLRSETLRGLDAPGEEWMGEWMGQWGFS